MRSSKWRGWCAAIALAMGVGFVGPVEAAGPAVKKAPVVVKETELEEATRLTGEVEQLTKEAKFDAALPLAERALAIREKALGSEHPDVAQSLNGLALLHANKGDYKRAEPLYQRALAIREKALGPDHVDVAQSLNGLVALYIETGDYARGELLCRRALAIREKALGPEHPDVGESIKNLAELYMYKGDDVRAEPLLQRALVIFEKALGSDDPVVATIVGILSLQCFAKGDYVRAERFAQRSLAIREKRLGPDHPEVSISLNNLGAIYNTQRDYVRAEPVMLRALAISEHALGPDHPDVAWDLVSLGRLYLTKGDYTHAAPLLQRSQTIWEKALGLDHPFVVVSLSSLAEIYVAQGDYARAEPLYQRTLTINEKALGPNHPKIAPIWNSMALFYAAQDRLSQAVSAARRATDMHDRNATAMLATGSEEQKRLLMNTLVGQTHQDISLHLQYAPTNKDAMRLAFTTLLRRKGRVLDSMTDSLALLRRSLAPGDRELLDQLASVYSKLATQLSRGPGDISPEQYRKTITALEDERQKLEADIAKRSASFRVEKSLVTFHDVQATLPKNAALLEIARYEPIQLPGISKPKSKREPRYAAYVLHSNGDPVFADLGEAAPLDSAIETLRHALADPDLTHDPKPAARALDRLLMQPIRNLLGDTRWVFVSADSDVHLVPFAALVDEDNHYLVERYLFSYVNTGRDLLRFAEDPITSREAPLVLANPAFDDSSAPRAPEATHRGLRSIDMVTQQLLPLRGTVEEAKTIHTLFPDSRVLTGVDATEEAVKAVHAPRMLHLATHGFFLPERPVPEVLLHATHGEPTPAERAAILQRENPLLRSGIALAGFNQRKSGIDDGVLTALEAAGLDLYGTRLVVLSACETGVGQASSGEGVYGLRRALSMAGAETQVMSLWQVDTGRTRELMQAYYGRLKGKGGRSESMRNVQLAMLANPETSHPNLWASFIVSGDWRALEGDAVQPDLTVHPGARGCACTYAGETTAPNGYWMAVAIGLVAMRRRRAMRRSITALPPSCRGGSHTERSAFTALRHFGGSD